MRFHSIIDNHPAKRQKQVESDKEKELRELKDQVKNVNLADDMYDPDIENWVFFVKTGEYSTRSERLVVACKAIEELDEELEGWELQYHVVKCQNGELFTVELVPKEEEEEE